jgi:AraC-like DNA-binding protein
MLSPSSMVRATHASVFHFGKVFHKSTGTNFTDYVSRARIQAAKARLLNPNLPTPFSRFGKPTISSGTFFSALKFMENPRPKIRAFLLTRLATAPNAVSR